VPCRRFWNETANKGALSRTNVAPGKEPLAVGIVTEGGLHFVRIDPIARLNAILGVIVRSVNDVRQDALVGLLLRLILVGAVAVVEVPQHLTLVERVHLITVVKHRHRPTSIHDPWRDIGVIEEQIRIVGHMKQGSKADAPGVFDPAVVPSHENWSCCMDGGCKLSICCPTKRR